MYHYIGFTDSDLSIMESSHAECSIVIHCSGVEIEIPGLYEVRFYRNNSNLPWSSNSKLLVHISHSSLSIYFALNHNSQMQRTANKHSHIIVMCREPE